MKGHSQLRAAGQAVSRPREGGRRAAGVNSPVESRLARTRRVGGPGHRAQGLPGERGSRSPPRV